MKYKLIYGATRNMDGPCATDRFSVFKVEMIDPTIHNVFRIKI
jgi:hypothetical protein